MSATTSIRDILAIIDLGGERYASKVAAELARKTGANLTGAALALDPLVPVYTVAAPIPTDFIAAAHDQAIAEAQQATEAFAAIAAAAGVAAESRVAESIAGDGFATLLKSALLTDLAVVGQNNPDQPEPMRDALIEVLLFQAGLPTLLVPYSGRTAFVPDRAVVAWNGSPAAGRGVRAAMPLLAQTKEVLVAIIDEGREQMPGVDIGAYLTRHGLNVTIRNIANAAGGVGWTLLDFASDEDAGWLVMGAYGHSRIREFLIGGVTRHILANATLPVLLAH